MTQSRNQGRAEVRVDSSKLGSSKQLHTRQQWINQLREAAKENGLESRGEPLQNLKYRLDLSTFGLPRKCWIVQQPQSLTPSAAVRRTELRARKNATNLIVSQLCVVRAAARGRIQTLTPSASARGKRSLRLKFWISDCQIEFELGCI